MGHELFSRGKVGPEALNTHATRVTAGEHALSLALRALTNVVIVVLEGLHVSINDVVRVGLTHDTTVLVAVMDLGPMASAVYAGRITFRP